MGPFQLSYRRAVANFLRYLKKLLWFTRLDAISFNYNFIENTKLKPHTLKKQSIYIILSRKSYSTVVSFWSHLVYAGTKWYQELLTKNGQVVV